MKVIKITPRGYCHGVVTALNIVMETINNKNTVKPIYILGEIVHNKNITIALEKKGVKTLHGKTRAEMLNKVDKGTVVITAHGINPTLITKAKKKGLCVIDATCSDVYKTHSIIKDRLKKNFKILYIGKENHPEPEGVLGINPHKIFLIRTKDDIDKIDFKSSEKLCITNQTTMSLFDVKDLLMYAKKKFPNLEIIDEICPATSQRQTAVYYEVKKADLTFVVGDKSSNNTNKLVEVSQKLSNCPAIRIDSVEDIDIQMLKDQAVETVAVTSGASTPTKITSEVISFLEKVNLEDPKTFNNSSNVKLTDILPRGRGHYKNKKRIS